MTLTKAPLGAKSATFRQGLYCVIWGFISGIYVWQPLLKFAHPHEQNSYTRNMKMEDFIIIKPAQKEEFKKS